MGQNLLSQLLGPHIVLDQLLITGPDQLISVTVIRKDPLFAMEFDYEFNGNIGEARWKVTRHNPKYYRYGLNRVTVANYGDILLTENPATRHVRFDSAQRTTRSTLQVIERSRNDRLPMPIPPGAPEPQRPSQRPSSGGDLKITS